MPKKRSTKRSDPQEAEARVSLGIRFKRPDRPPQPARGASWLLPLYVVFGLDGPGAAFVDWLQQLVGFLG